VPFDDISRVILKDQFRIEQMEAVWVG